MYNDEIAIRSLPLRGLYALQVLMECDGKFSAAAAHLNISVPALSQQLARLKADLGISLIRLSPTGDRSFELTDEGWVISEAFEKAIPALAQLAKAIVSISPRLD